MRAPVVAPYAAAGEGARSRQDAASRLTDQLPNDDVFRSIRLILM
jgi:hypothetical protein